MSKSFDEVKEDLMKLAKPYLQELEDLLKQDESSSSVVSVSVHEQAHATDTVDATVVSGEKTQFMRRLFDFQNVIMTIYIHTSGKEHPLPSLIDYIDYFSSRGVIYFPIQNNRVRTLVSNLQNFSEIDIDGSWIESFKNEKIDLVANINRLFEYLTDFNIKNIVESYGFVYKPKLIEYNSDHLIISAKSDHSKVILTDVRFRNSIKDFKSIVLRAIETYNDYVAEFEFASKYLIVFVYSQDQDYEVSKAEAKFKKHLVEIDESLIRNIYFVPISLYKLQEIKSKLELCIKSIGGFEITFDYQDSPLAHKWHGPPDLSKLNSIFRLTPDSSYGHILQLRLPIQAKYYIDYPIPLSSRNNFKNVSFIIKPGNECSFYIEISIKDNNKRFWFNVKQGDGLPTKHSNFEYTIYKKFIPYGIWFLVKVDVLHEFGITFGPNAVTLNKIEGLRLRGEIDVAKIYFE